MTKSKLPAFVASTLAESTFNAKTAYLLEMSDSHLLFHEVSQPSGFPYADQVSLDFIIEFHQPFPEANQIVMRYSDKIDWHPQPWVLSGLIEMAS